MLGEGVLPRPVDPDAAPLLVLVADDNPTDRLILGRLVERLGHRVCLAEDGEQAVSLFVERQPDIAPRAHFLARFAPQQKLSYSYTQGGDHLQQYALLGALATRVLTDARDAML